MVIEFFLKRLRGNDAEMLDYEDTMAVIDGAYDFLPTAFTIGDVVNEANTSNVSCKIFAFAKIHSLTPDETLACYGRFYREHVLGHPDGTDHGNIRSFMKCGWAGVSFAGKALTLK